MTVRLLRDETRGWHFRLLQVMGVVAYLSAYLAAWRKAADLAIAEYAKLPVVQPDQCYVCTAATRGHGRLVVSSSFVGDDGKSFSVNWQLRRLKAFEIVLAAIAPSMHRRLRHAYDRVGPLLARRLNSRWSADLAYVSLKPSEWLAVAALRILSIRTRQVERLYRSEDG